MLKHKLTKIIIIVLITAFLGELKITPFDSSFRFGLGGAGFFFLLLVYKDVPYIMTGFITGVFTTLFRSSLDFFRVDTYIFLDSLLSHCPIIGYYLIFAVVFQFTKRKDVSLSPLLMGVFGTVSDTIANISELLLHLLIEDTRIYPITISYIVLIAFFRSFFVVGLYNMIESNKLKAVYLEQQSRFEQVQTILSELYIEVFYLKKTLTEIENVTMKAHDLYQELKRTQTNIETSRVALSIAQEVHEVKKDNQRILVGLEKVIHQENTMLPLSLSDIIHLCVCANKKYIDFLQKDIDIKVNQVEDFKIIILYPLLIILNNLISNAIEASTSNGFVEINVERQGNHLIFKVSDNGHGIHPDEHQVIFEPGFTTKFTESGKPSTGIGLSHVKLMVEELQGTIKVHSTKELTTFTITLPIECLV